MPHEPSSPTGPLDSGSRHALIQHGQTVAAATDPYEAIFQLLPDAIAVTDGNGRIALVNQQTEALFGYSRDALIGQPFEMLLPSRLHAEFRRERSDYLKHPDSLPMGAHVPLWGVRRDDSEFPIAVSIGPIPHTDGPDATTSRYRFLVTIRNETEHQRLATSAERAAELETTIDVIPDPVGVYDAKGHIVRANAALRRLLSLDADPTHATLGPVERSIHRPLRYPDGQPVPPEENGISRVLRGEQLTSEHPWEVIITTLDGREVWMSVTGARLFDPQGNVTGAVVAMRDVTERRRLERASRERADELEASIESMPDGVGIYDGEGHLVRANVAFRHLLGVRGMDEINQLSPEERITRLSLRSPDGNIIAPEQHPVRQILSGHAIPTTEPMELVIRTVGGRDVWISLSGAPLRQRGTTTGKTTADNRITGAVLTLRDITERRQLEEWQRFQASMLERAHEPIFLWDLRGGIVYWNRGAELTYGYTADEAIGHSAHDLLHTQLPEPASDFDAHLSANGEWTGELVHTTKDGRKLRMVCRLQTLRGEMVAGDARVYVVQTGQDITVRARAEERAREALRALIEMARALVERPTALIGAEPPTTDEDLSATTQAVHQSTQMLARRLAELTCDVLGCRRVSLQMVDRDTREMHALAVVGLTPEQEARWWNEQQIAPRYGEGADPEQLAHFEAGEAIVQDLTVPPHNELPNPYGVTTVLAAPLRLGGTVVGVLALDYDGAPHEFTADELALAEAVGELAALVIERDRLIAERADAQARELAERESSHHMDEFLGIVNHELKTPLTVLKTNLELLERRLPRLQAAPAGADAEGAASHAGSDELATVQRLVQRSRDGVTRMTRLVEDLVDASRTRSGKLELQLAPCDLATLVRDSVEEQRQIHPSRQIALELPPTEPLPVRADPMRATQVVTNYLTNALKYSEESAPVEVRAVRDGAVARVSVRDHGPGLSMAQRRHIWDAFYRAEGIEVLSGPGVSLGLGLHICKTIVERLGGQVGVNSTVGQGSTFWFTLPLELVDSQTARA